LTSARRAFARWTADTVVEQIHDLVRDPCCGLAQNASSARWRTTRSRRPITWPFAGTHVLRQQPPPVRRNHLQIRGFVLQRALESF